MYFYYLYLNGINRNTQSEMFNSVAITVHVIQNSPVIDRQTDGRTDPLGTEPYK